MKKLKKLSKDLKDKKEWFEQNFECIGIITDKGKILIFSDVKEKIMYSSKLENLEK